MRNENTKELSREKKLRLNSILSLVNQVVIIIHGLILPRLYISNYGSSTYGLISSITQFLAVISLMELGIGAVVQSALYKPLAENNYLEISKIIKSAERFFTKIGIVFLFYTFILSIIYPVFINKDFGWLFEASLVLIISLSSLSEYMFGITYRLLVIADQRAYISNSLQFFCYFINIILCASLIRLGYSIQIVKLVSVTIFMIKPIILMKYVRNKYNIDTSIEYTEEPIKQKWNGVAQHLAYYITQQTDVLILTIFSTLGNVAIYSVYSIVTNGISVLIYSLNNGTQALLGNMLAKNEQIQLNKFFSSMEWIIHNVVVFLYTCVAMLIVPFVMVYTQGVNDINYYQPVFAAFITASSAIYCIRLPYNMMVLAAGHYKQTQNSSIIEMCLNVSVTLVLVNKYGLVGAAIGTLVALTYRTVYLAYYLSKNIINHKFSIFIKRVFEDIILTILIVISTSSFRLEVYSYLGWLELAVKVAIIAIFEMVIFNYLFERKKTMATIHKVIKRA